jgi:hypothetical protein
MVENRRRGVLQINGELSARAGVDREGLAGGLSSWAQAFGQIGDRVGKMADHAAAREGAEAGRAAGLDPEFRPSKALTIRGEAFDRAGLDVHRTKALTAFSADLAAAYDQFGHDPAELSKALAAKRQSWKTHSIPEIHPDLDLQFEQASLAFMRQAARDQAKRAADEAQAAAMGETQRRFAEMQQRAYALGLDAEADAAVAADQAGLAEALDRKGPDGKPLFTPEQRVKMLSAARSGAVTARLLGAYSRLPTLEEKEAFIAKFREDFTASEGLAKEYDLDGFRAVEGLMEAELRAGVAGRNAQLRLAEDQVKRFEKAAAEGYDLPEAEMQALKSLAGLSPEIEARVERATRLAEWSRAARAMRPEELEAQIGAMREAMAKDGATPEALAVVEHSERLLTEMRGVLKTDPLGWMERAGLFSAPPLDFSSPEAAARSLATRVAQADEAGRYYGQEPVYLRPDEKRRLAVAVSQGGDAALALTMEIARAGGDRATAILAEVFDDAPAASMLGGLAVATNGASPVLADAAAGMALFRTEGYKPLGVSRADARAAFMDVTGGALGDFPRSEDAAIQLANAVYEVRARRAAQTDFDAKLWRRGLSEILGERTIADEVYGGVVNQNDWFDGRGDAYIVLPPEVKQSSWREVLDAITPDDLKAAGLGLPQGRGGAVPWSRAKSGTLRQAGDGRYYMEMGEGQGLLGEDGQKFVLDLKRLTPILRARRPDLFLGG